MVKESVSYHPDIINISAVKYTLKMVYYTKYIKSTCFFFLSVHFVCISITFSSMYYFPLMCGPHWHVHIHVERLGRNMNIFPDRCMHSSLWSTPHCRKIFSDFTRKYPNTAVSDIFSFTVGFDYSTMVAQSTSANELQQMHCRQVPGGLV